MEIIGINQGQIVLSFVFLLSILVQSILILRRKVFSFKYILGFIISLVGFIPREDQQVYNIATQLLLYFVVLILYIGFMFREEIKPHISERTLLQSFVILLYALSIDKPIAINIIIVILIALIFPVLLFGVTTSNSLRKTIKIYSYFWFLISSICLVLLQTDNINIHFFLTDTSLFPSNEDLQKTFFSGIILFPVVTSIGYLLEILTIPFRPITSEKKRRGIDSVIVETLGKFNNYQIKISEVLKIILVQGGFLIGNHYFGFVDPLLAISISIFFVELVVYARIDYWRILSLNLSNFIPKK